MDEELLGILHNISDKLISKRHRLSVAESCTGGLLAHTVTNLPGASKFFDSGVVSYSEEAKKSVLGVNSAVLRKHGTVSEETAVAMAQGVKRLTGTEVSLAVTGVAGPDRVEGKDAGLVYVAVKIHDHLETRGMKLIGGREEIKEQATREALRFLSQVLRLWL